MNAPPTEKKYNIDELAIELAKFSFESEEHYIGFLTAVLGVSWAAGKDAIIMAAIAKPLHTYTDKERKKVQTFAVGDDVMRLFKETLPREEKE